MTPIPARCDVLILGGGPAGSAAAIHLRRSESLSVVVAEATDAPRERYGESVPPDIFLLLDRLGLSAEFRAAGHLPCPGSVSIWGRPEPGYNDFILNPMGPAWHLSRTRFESMLVDGAERAGATVHRSTRFVDARPVDDGFEVDLRRHGETHSVRARWVIDATGGPARLARRLGATLTVLDRMVAVARFADLSAGELSSQTLLEAVGDGWWYAARLPENRVVTVLVTEPELAKALAVDEHEPWREELKKTELLAPRLAECELRNEAFHTFPVVSSKLEPVEGERWLAVGDAASSFDPIAAQGIHKALCDAEDAARRVSAALGHGPAPPWRYADRVRERLDDYLANREYLYGLERRRPESEFWRRRREASAP